MAHSTEELLAKIRVLEEENMALAEKVEYSILLNVIAESTERTEDISLMVESVLEKICIVKQLSYAALFSLHDSGQKLENSYQLYGTGKIPEKGFLIPEKIIQRTCEAGFLILNRSQFGEYEQDLAEKYPEIQTLLFYHFSARFFPNSILLFVDSDPDSQLYSMLYLFEQVINYLVEKLDKLYYWTELHKLNNELETRVNKRTEDLQAANRSLKAKEEFIRSIYDAAKNVSFITVDRENGELLIQSFSPGSSRLFGYAVEEITGQPLSALLSQEIIDRLDLFKQGSRAVNLELKLIKKSGEYIHVLHNSFPICDDAGKPVSELLVCIDITRLKQVQQQLIEAKNTAVKADSLKTIFLQNISHEIRTPLNAIIGFSNLLNKPDVPSEKIGEFTGIIASSGAQLLSLLNDILDISKIESGQYDIRFEEVDLRPLMTSLEAQFGPMARHRGLEFELEIPPKERRLLVETDFIKLRQVLMNLIGNAIKFTEKGSVRLICMQNPDEVVIAVADTGIGIASEHHEIIFNRFRQLDLRSVRSYRGTGLGLYICKTYMDLLGGHIRVESELGKGSTFSVRLTTSRSKKTSGIHEE